MSGLLCAVSKGEFFLTPSAQSRLKQRLLQRGPDAQYERRAPGIYMQHSLMETSHQHRAERQPFTMDEQLFVVADARLDDRTHLAEKLGLATRKVVEIAESELIWRAFRKWGSDCVDHLAGDFVFCVWDSSSQKLFAARDQMGCRQLYYAYAAETLWVSNDLPALRLIPQINRAYDPDYLRDFLIGNRSLDAHATAFREIKVLPPASSLSFKRGATAATTRNYWQLPEQDYFAFKNARDAVEPFRDLFIQAVSDRSQTDCIALSLSGGLDSGAIACAVTGSLGNHPMCSRVEAISYSWEKIFEDHELDYAQLSASSLGIQLKVEHCLLTDPTEIRDVRGHPPGPEFMLGRKAGENEYTEAMRGWHTRILLDGQGGDEVFGRELMIDELLRPNALSIEASVRAWLGGDRPALGLRELWLRPLSMRHDRATESLPDWLLSDAHYRDRRQALSAAAEQIRTTTLKQPRGNARLGLHAATWHPYFTMFDMSNTSGVFYAAWPFLDLRLIGFLLRLPPHPYATRKRLLRWMLEGVLPAAVVNRPKTPLKGSAIDEYRKSTWPDADLLWQQHGAALSPYVDFALWKAHWSKAADARTREYLIEAPLRAVMLSRWMEQNE